MLNKLRKLLKNLDEVQAQGGAGPGVNNIQREINALLRSMSPTSAARVRNATRTTSAGSARAAHQLEVAAQEVHKKKPTRRSALARRAAGAIANVRQYKRSGGPSQYQLMKLTGQKRKYMAGLEKEMRKPPKHRRTPPLRKTANRNMSPPSRASSNGSYGNNKRRVLAQELMLAENEQNRRRIQALINQLNALNVVEAEIQPLNSYGSRGWGRMSGVARSRSRTPSSRSTTTKANSQRAGSSGSVTGPHRARSAP
jgi:hypothetical protein